MQDTTPGFLCPSVTLRTPFRHPLGPRKLQGTAVILKIYGHHSHFDFLIIVHHTHLASYCRQNDACTAACRNRTILTDSLILSCYYWLTEKPLGLYMKQ